MGDATQDSSDDPYSGGSSPQTPLSAIHRPPGMSSPQLSPIVTTAVRTPHTVVANRHQLRTERRAVANAQESPTTLGRTMSVINGARGQPPIIGSPLSTRAYSKADAAAGMPEAKSASMVGAREFGSPRNFSKSVSDLPNNDSFVSENFSMLSLADINPVSELKAKYADSLFKVLSDPKGVAAFKMFGQGKYNDEFMFLAACDEHKKNRGARALSESAVRVCENHIVFEAPHPVLLSPAVTKQLEDHATHADVGFFLRAQAEVFFKMLLEFPKFILSGEYHMWKEDDPSGKLEQGDSLGPLSPRKKKDRSLTRSLSGSTRSKSMAKKFMGRLAPGGNRKTRLSSLSVLRSQLNKDEEDTNARAGAPPAILLCHVHIWQLWKYPSVSQVEPGIHKFFLKPAKKGMTNVEYTAERKIWAEGRDISWIPLNVRPHRKRQNTQEYQEVALANRPVTLIWKSRSNPVVLYNDASIVSFNLKESSADYDTVRVDKNLSAKVQDKGFHLISDVAYLSDKQSMLLTFCSKPGIAFVSPADKGLQVSTVDSPQKGGATDSRLSVHVFDPVIGEYQKTRPAGYLALNSTNTMLVQWWPRPDPDFLAVTNVMLISVDTGRRKLIPRCNIRPEKQIYDLWFSKNHYDRMYMLAGGMSTFADTTITLAVYHCWCSEDSPTKPAKFRYFNLRSGSPKKGSKHGMNLFESCTFSLPGPLAVHSCSTNEEYVVFACTTGDLVVAPLETEELPRTEKTRRSTTLHGISTIEWHPNLAVFAVATSSGQVQVFDIALVPVWLSIASETMVSQPLLDFSKMNFDFNALKFMSWGQLPLAQQEEHNVSQIKSTETLISSDKLMLVFELGPCVAIRFDLGVNSQYTLTTSHLINERLRHYQVQAAIALLQTFDWKTEADVAIGALTSVLDVLLRCSFSPEVNNLIRSAFPDFSWKIYSSQSVVTKSDASIRALHWRYFFFLLKYEEHLLALHLASELMSREMCKALSLAAKQMGGNDGQVLYAIAQSAADQCPKTLNTSFV